MFERRSLNSIDPLTVKAEYDALYASSAWLPARASMFRWVIRLLRPVVGQKLLDVACGDGGFVEQAAKGDWHYYGIDFSFPAIEQHVPGAISVADGHHLPFASSQFDFVTNLGSLEHFWDMDQGVREMARVVKPTGTVCILVPNAFSLTWNIWHVWRHGDLSDDDQQPIQRFGTRRSWEALIERNGLRIDRVKGYERTFPVTRAEWNEYRRQPREAILALLAPFLPINAQRTFVFLCHATQSGTSFRQDGSVPVIS